MRWLVGLVWFDLVWLGLAWFGWFGWLVGWLRWASLGWLVGFPVGLVFVGLGRLVGRLVALSAGWPVCLFVCLCSLLFVFVYLLALCLFVLVCTFVCLLVGRFVFVSEGVCFRCPLVHMCSSACLPFCFVRLSASCWLACALV